MEYTYWGVVFLKSLETDMEAWEWSREMGLLVVNGDFVGGILAMVPCRRLPSGKPTKNYWTSPFLMGKLTISMAIFNSKLLVYQRVSPTLRILLHWKCLEMNPRNAHQPNTWICDSRHPRNLKRIPCRFLKWFIYVNFPLGKFEKTYWEIPGISSRDEKKWRDPGL